MSTQISSRPTRVLPIVAALLLALPGCGGGGGGGGGDGNGDTEIRYTGNTSPAVLNTSNASALVNAVIGGDDASDFLDPFGLLADADRPHSPDYHNALGLHRSFKDAMEAARRALDDFAARRSPHEVSVDDREPCDSGWVYLTGTLADDGTGTLDVDYMDCRFDQVTANGEGTLTIWGFVFAPNHITDMELSSPNLHFTGPGLDSRASFTIRFELETGVGIWGTAETVTSDFVSVDQNNGRQIMAENLVQTGKRDYPHEPTSYSDVVISGRVFDSLDGYVDITTPEGLFYATLDQTYPDSGRLRLTGASNAQLLATTLSLTRVELSLDADGDGSYETVAMLDWRTLAGPGGELGDGDSDGLPDGWEITNDLDPTNPDDSLLDDDSDGFTNLDEYQLGTDPNDSSSMPPTADLSITVTAGPDPVAAGELLAFTITVRNLGPDAADDVVVTDELPATLMLAAVTSSLGGCSGSTTVICDLGVLSPGQVATLSISATPTVAGIEHNSMSVSMSITDPDPANNRTTVTTTIGTPSSSLQALIDAAVPDETILVPPGLYIGLPEHQGRARTTIDFKGKNITLASTAGPQDTIIHGRGGTAVRMGPDGTIRGFTITGTTTFYGDGGVDVTGSGSVISGNIFDGNIEEDGGQGRGVAIGGGLRGGSPSTIEGNTFRNIACLSPVIAVVTFRGSPLIVNNIFENNACPAILLHGASEAQVINNTFRNNSCTISCGVVSIRDSASPQLANNVFENNPTRAIYMGPPSRIGASNPQIINNTLVGNRTGVLINRRASLATDVYRNNIIVYSGIGLDSITDNDANNQIWENNLVFGNTTNYQGTADQTGTAGNISADPLFVDAEAGDYRLQTGSPAIDSGNANGAPTVDFDGTSRPQDGDRDGTAIVDIGAFELLVP